MRNLLLWSCCFFSPLAFYASFIVRRCWLINMADKQMLQEPLTLEDPVKPQNNVGRNSFQIYEVKQAFEEAYTALHSTVTDDDCATPEVTDNGTRVEGGGKPGTGAPPRFRMLNLLLEKINDKPWLKGAVICKSLEIDELREKLQGQEAAKKAAKKQQARSERPPSYQQH
jgi:DNA polymerase sigma